MKFSYCTGYRASPQPCEKATFEALTGSEAVKAHITAFRAGDKDAKKRLPAFCFHATFTGDKRVSAEAVPSGLVMIDFDHLSPEELRQFVAAATPAPEEEQTTEVMLIHITPSGRGLRIVIKAVVRGYEQCRTIADYQHAFARKIGAEHRLDEVTTDLARLSFCPQQCDLLYVNERIWTDAPERTDFGDTPAHRPSPAVRGTVLPAAGGTMQEYYRGLPLKRIFEAYFVQNGGLPDEGERNTRFYEAARMLRYICDFNPRTIAAHLPDVGLPYEEVLAVCVSACQSVRYSSMPAQLQELVEQLSTEEAESDEEGTEDPAERQQKESKRLSDDIPPLFRKFTALYPPAHSEAVVLALLPIIGVLSTRLRAVYLDREVHSPSFMTVVSAEQASGKSFTRNLVRILLHSIAEEDQQSREKEQNYLKQLRLMRNAKKQPEEPVVKIRIIPPSISVAKLLQRLDQAHGDHLFSFAEELDTVIKSNRAGAWSAKMDIYRNGFDNAEYGQDFMSEASYSATVQVFYNLLFCGTPRQLERFLKDVENGLVSRFCFAFLPDQFGALMPSFRQLSLKDEAYIAEAVNRLRQARGTVNLSFLEKPISDWLEEQRIRSIGDNDRARDVFRRRAAVIGFRAALAVSPLYAPGEKSRQQLTRFALRIASLTLKNQLAFAGTRLNALLEESKLTYCRVQHSVFEAMGEVFTVEDLKREMERRRKLTPVRTIIYRWKKAGLILPSDAPKVYIKKHGKTEK